MVRPETIVLQLAIQMSEPIFAWGGDGEGKTEQVGATSNALDFLMIPIILGNRDPSDLVGLPVVVTDPETWETCVVRVPDKPFYIARERAREGKKTCLFFDEMNQTAPLTIAAAQNILSSFCAGDVVLDRRYVSMVAAANPPGIATGARNFKPPVCTRVTHVNWELGLEEYIEGEMEGWPDPTPIRLPADWEEKNSLYARTLTTGFLGKFGESFFRQDPASAPQNWSRPNPRTWSRARRAIAALESVQATDEVWRTFLQGILGSGPVDALMEYRVMLGLVSPDDVLADPEGVEIPARRDLVYVLCSALANRVLNLGDWPAFNAAAEFYARIPDDKRDCCANSAIQLAKKLPQLRKGDVISNKWERWGHLGLALQNTARSS